MSIEQLNEDEVEFFGFLPITFTNELQEELLECLNDIVHQFHLHHKIQTYILDSFRKNMFIFSNFVLRNILKFPASFKLERKITDKTIQADASEFVSILQQKQEKLFQLRVQVQELKTKIAVQNMRSTGYQNLLQNKAKLYDLCTGAREIRTFLEETSDLYEKYRAIGKRRDCEFEKLMEYKHIKSEYYKNERNKLLEIADFEVLESINKHI